jgi:hypothetical protein
VEEIVRVELVEGELQDALVGEAISNLLRREEEVTNSGGHGIEGTVNIVDACDWKFIDLKYAHMFEAGSPARDLSAWSTL